MRVSKLDVRRIACRDDLAADYLRGQVEVPDFAHGKERQVTAASVPVRRRPAAEAPLDTEALCGDRVIVYDESDGWAWVQLVRDRYVGYVPSEALSAELSTATHRVSALRTFIYPEPNIKVPPSGALSLNSGLMAQGEEGAFLTLASGGYVYGAHAVTAGSFDTDFVAVAERFVGTPYLWGGIQSFGIDCSGLVQTALRAAGHQAPRDTDMQETEMGEDVAQPHKAGVFTRGDLVFWKGHVGIMLDSERLLHANGFHMATVIEPVADAMLRIAKSEGEVTSVRRLPHLTASA